MVAVPPRIEAIMILVPSKAASRKDVAVFPIFSFALKQLSSTLIELSTIIPTPRTRLPRVITFREKPMALIRINAARMEIGMDVPTIRDALMSPKNSHRMIMEMITAITMVSITLFKEALILSLLSSTTTMSRFGLLRSRRSMVLFTAFDTSPAEDSCCFLIASVMVSLPL